MRNQPKGIIMFKNREFSLRVNKIADHKNTDETETKVLEDRVALAHTVVKDLVKTIFIGVCAFVVLDTARQVAIARNTQSYNNW